MTFLELLYGAEVLSQSGNPGIGGLEYDSRRIKPGDAFVAMQGESSDGNKFIDQAIAAGAVAIVTDSATEKSRPDVAWAQVPHGRRALARLSANFYKKPAERLAIERVQLQPVPTPYGGRSVRALQKPVPAPIIGLQHPLSFYDAFAGGVQ